MGKIRCTQPEEKARKKSDILREARNFFSKQSFFEITMGQIADQIGLAKGTIYLYFKTKEDLFLELLKEDIKIFFKALSEQIYFNELTESESIWRTKTLAENHHENQENFFASGNHWQSRACENLVLAFAQSLEKCSLSELLILLKPILEEKIASEERQLFRQWIQKEIHEVSQILVQCGYFEKITFSNRFAYQAFAGVVGLYQLSSISRNLTSLNEQNMGRAEFHMALKTFLTSLYKSYQNDAIEQTKRLSSIPARQLAESGRGL